MHDKAVRRRRAVLVVLVAASLILLTAYYGESSDGRLHSIQRGALGVLSPIQEGASRVFKPVRDLFGWFGDTIDAKDQRDEAIKERDALRTQLADRPTSACARPSSARRSTRSTHAGHGQVRARRRPRLRALAEHLVPAHRDQQGHQRRRPPRRPGDQRRRAGRQGRGRHGRQRGRDADHRPELRHRRHRRRRRASRAASRPRSAPPATCCSSPSTPTAKVKEGDFVYTAGTTDSRLKSATRRRS